VVFASGLLALLEVLLEADGDQAEVVRQTVHLPEAFAG
jgi:hypothetical protein